MSRSFPEELTALTNEAYSYARDRFCNHLNVVVEPFNSVVVGIYFREKRCFLHRDQRYTTSGKFMHCQNSQMQKTLTLVLTVGSSREIRFVLMKHNDQSTGTGPIQLECVRKFSLTHGSMFSLHPEDEETRIRPCLYPAGSTFYKHGVEFGKKDEMSIALMMRTTIHLRPYNRLTGQYLVADCTQVSAESENRDRELEKLLQDRVKIRDYHIQLKRLFDEFVMSRLQKY